MIGEQIGQYKIVAAIGQGGMATVYKAYQAAFDRYVAIKVLSRQFSDDPTFVKRFQREARVIARIEHRSIVPMYDYGEENGLYYIAMRLIEGGTLRKKMFYDKIDLATTARITQQVAEALDYAHQHDVIHRDLKPSNILLDERGNAYLTDFGIAKMLGSNTQVTQSGVVGTPSYMSPEQCQGKTLGPPSDIYSLGAILFEVLTGGVPFEADTPLSVMYMHVRDPIPSARAINPKLPSAIDRLFMRVLAKQPGERYPSAVAMVSDFRQIAGLPEETFVKPQQKDRRPMLGGLFKKRESPASPPRPAQPSVPQAVVVDERSYPTESHGAVEEEDLYYEEYSQPEPVRQPRAASQTLLAGAVGVIAVLGLVGAGIVGLSSLTQRGSTVRVPTLPPTLTATVEGAATQTAVYVVVTSDGATPTVPSGGILEPSLTPTPTNTPLALNVSPTNTSPPTVTPIPPTATAVPPTNTPLPPTNTPIPPTDTPVPTILRGNIVYTEGENNTAEIVVIDANGQNRQQITSNNQYEGEPDWSPDKSWIAYEATIGIDTDIYTMTASGGDVRRMTTTGQPNRHPDWSPDGTLIAYESGRDETSEIYVVNADGSGTTRVTNNAFGDRAPKFSPDGTKIAYMTHQRDKWEIAILAYPAGNQVSLFDCPAPDCRFPAWSAGGDKIAYNTLNAQGTESGIWVLDVASGQSSVLLQGSEDGRPTWSGNGKVVYFNRTVSGGTDIYRMIIATGELLRLTTVPKQAYGPDWGS